MAAQIPQARVVRKAGQLFAPPPHPRGPVADQLWLMLSTAIGMWPLTGVVLLLIGLLILAGNNAH